MSNAENIWNWLQSRAQALGLECLGVSDTDLSACEPRLQAWLDNGMHGEMAYMEKHGLRRVQADTLLPGTVNIVSVRVNYVPEPKSGTNDQDTFCQTELAQATNNKQPYVSVYARGRDYHKVMRKKLQALMAAVHEKFGEFGYRVAVDSAPAPEVEIARKAGLGWRGKHTLLIHPEAGSLFFLGEIYTNLPLPISKPFEANHCGSCSACVQACPTGAILEGSTVDARRCISYLTIEHQNGIPVDLRKAMGTRIYGCDDCQLVCPWNKFAQPAVWADFEARHGLDRPDLMELLDWDEAQFLKRTEGMAMRRIGFERFQRNLAVASGNSPRTEALIEKLKTLRSTASPMVQEHIEWALVQLEE